MARRSIVNIILFSLEEVEHPLPRKDSRAIHILDVLRLRTGDTFDAGLIDGPIGKGCLASIEEDSITLSFSWTKSPPPLSPIQLFVGLPRPQTARDILRDATTLGIRSICFICTERSEPSYRSSSLWKSGEWRNCVINGAAQAFCTRLPEISHEESLVSAVSHLAQDEPVRIALDNYEASISLGKIELIDAKSVVLAIGSERGWSPAERQILKNSGFVLAHLGTRVQRTETACIAAITLINSKLGCF